MFNPYSSPADLPDPLPKTPQPALSLWGVLELWFGVSRRVTPRAYAISGVSLALLKYAVEAFAIWVYTSSFFTPLQFINPSWTIREPLLRPAPLWLAWALFLWTLPFLWIAVTMSIRRAADAAISPWLGLLVLAPIVNLLFMLMMCLMASDEGAIWSPTHSPPSNQDRMKCGALAVGASVMIGGLMLWVSVYLLSTYGTALFLGTPMLMGTTAAYLYNRPHPRGYGSSASVGLLSVAVAGAALCLFALEGVFCVAMALPLLLPIGAMGGVLGKAIADCTRRPGVELLGAVLLWPLLAGGESLLVSSREYVVLTTVEIDAPPEAVWNNVVDFPDLTEPRPWYFRWGIACPERARIEGRGPHGTRYCEFTTGVFVEPITDWSPPRRLAFDVAQQPAPMFELSPYRNIHPPHLDHSLRSTRGEFLLIPLPGGRTRLEGRTWYKFDMFPQWFWTLWSDMMIHNIHQRVLLHIKRLSESPPAPPAAGAGGQAGQFGAKKNGQSPADRIGCTVVACLCHPPRDAYDAGNVRLEDLPNRRRAFDSRRGARDDEAKPRPAAVHRPIARQEPPHRHSAGPRGV